MGQRIHHGLFRRLFLLIGLATIFPLVTFLAIALVEVYHASSVQTNDRLKQVSRRYSAEFQAELTERLGLLKALASLDATIDDQTMASTLRALDPSLKDAWVRREGPPPRDETEEQRRLYHNVQLRQTEVLSRPDFSRNVASLGFPLVGKAGFRGMVAVSFSLDYFQTVVAKVKLYDHGYGFLTAHDGTRIAHPDARLVGVKVGNDLGAQQAGEIIDQVDQGVEFAFEKQSLVTGLWSRLYYSPVTVGRSWDPWYFVAVVPLSEANADTNRLFLVLVLGILATLAMVGVTTWWATRSVVRPLTQLADAAESVAAGHLTTRMPTGFRDEVKTLAESFNRMTDRLVAALQDQEELVRQRTASLRQSLHDLEAAQKKIVETEKLALLGQLMATIAHEINTPLGAIRSSATFLHRQSVGSQSELPGFLRTLDEVSMARYTALVAAKDCPLTAPRGVGDRKRRRALAQELRRLGAADAEGLADDIVFLVPPDQDGVLLEDVKEGRCQVIRHAAAAAAQVQSAAIILEASDRAAATVAALVNYSRNQGKLTDQPVDLAEELETLLTLYYGQAKQGVHVERQLEPGLVVRGDRDKLNQVWVNLINNALQAMGYKGTLLLRTKTRADGIEVTVGNDGPPVPPELRDEIFRPFFTTKRVGEGTGLGLDICRRIVEAHGGTITLGTEGSYTLFVVSLPSLPPRSPT